jgi:Fur family ferric uptake transcriptional regulator
MNIRHLSDKAKDLIKQNGSSITESRIRVLSYLLTQENAVSHHAIEAALEQSDNKVDRVTLYRTLDWLTNAGLVHKVASIDRSWRFRVNHQETEAHQHAHFKCKQCSKVTCLDDLPSDSQSPLLPEGYRGIEVELTVKGICAECAH